MPKPNTTGISDPNDYNLGRGVLYYSPLSNGLPTVWRDLGNCPAFTISQEVETLEHKSSRSGLATVDKEVVLSQKMTINFQLDEINADNLALFLSGETGTFTNPAVAGVAEQVAKYTSVELGRWYDLTDSNGVRIYGVDSADVLLEKDDVADVTLVEGTDYTLDPVMGRFFLKSTAVNVAAGDDVNVTITADAMAPTPINEVKALTQTSILCALKFISENPANNDEQTEYQMHQVNLKADGEFSLLSDEWSTLGFTGVLERNETADADSPYMTVRTHSES